MNFPTKTTATRLAAALGEGWTPVHPEAGNSCVTRESDGLTLVVSEVGPQTGRARVSVLLSREEVLHAYQSLYPQFANHDTTFDPARLTKQPGAVAAQVIRNVVTPGATEYARLKESMAKAAEREVAQRENFATLGLEARDKPGRPGELSEDTTLRVGNNVWGSARVTDTRVDLELHSLTVEQAKAVLDLLRG